MKRTVSSVLFSFLLFFQQVVSSQHLLPLSRECESVNRHLQQKSVAGELHILVSDNGEGMSIDELENYSQGSPDDAGEWHFSEAKTENIGLNIIF